MRTMYDGLERFPTYQIRVSLGNKSFVRPPIDTIIGYFKIFHLAPSPSSARFDFPLIKNEKKKLFKIRYEK